MSKTYRAVLPLITVGGFCSYISMDHPSVISYFEKGGYLCLMVTPPGQLPIIVPEPGTVFTSKQTTHLPPLKRLTEETARRHYGDNYVDGVLGLSDSGGGGEQR